VRVRRGASVPLRCGDSHPPWCCAAVEQRGRTSKAAASLGYRTFFGALPRSPDPAQREWSDGLVSVHNDGMCLALVRSLLRRRGSPHSSVKNYCSGLLLISGSVISQASPWGCQSKGRPPLSWFLIMVSMTFEPKPRLFGSSTGGPPVSIQWRTMEPTLSDDHSI
jgi:hypothetical protein